jgi:hypothetical protein
MNKLFSIFLILQITAFCVPGAIAAEKTRTPSATGLPDDFNIEDHRKGRNIIMIEDAIETESLQISLNARTGTGVVIGRICDQCDEIQVQITPKTRAYDNDKEVPLAKARDRLGRYAVVFFEKDKKNVTRIKW